MYIISLEKKTETNQGQPWATSAARQGDLLHMLCVTHKSRKIRVYKDRAHSRSHKSKIRNDIRHRSAGQRCTAFDMN